jgi:hypothetical protein
MKNKNPIRTNGPTAQDCLDAVLAQQAGREPSLADCMEPPPNLPQIMRQHDRDKYVIELMDELGGDFVRALAQAAALADDDNLRHLKAAFPELWLKYGRGAITNKVNKKSLT